MKKKKMKMREMLMKREKDEDGEDTDDSLDVPEDDANSPSVVDEEEQAEEETCKGRNNPNILTVDELIAKFRSICDHVHSSDSEDAVTTIGLVIHIASKVL